MLPSKARCFLALSVFISTVALASCRIEEIYRWKYLTYDDPQNLPASEDYIPMHNIPTGIAVTKDKIILALPSFYTGVPSTLSAVHRNSSLHSGPTSPSLRPYPNWAYQNYGNYPPYGPTNCSAFIFVYKIREDSQNRLWVLDSGVKDKLSGAKRLCPPKLVVIDLLTDTVVKIFTFSQQVYDRANSIPQNLVIDETCDGIYVYIADAWGYGLIVYSELLNQAWRVTNKAMVPDPKFTSVTIDNQVVEITDGVYGLALSPITDEDRVLYYQPFAGLNIYQICTSELKLGFTNDLPIEVFAVKPSQGTTLAVNPVDGTVYAAPLARPSIVAYGKDSAWEVEYNPQLLDFATELTFSSQVSRLYVLSIGFEKIINGICDYDYKFRISRIDVDDDDHESYHWRL